MLESYRKMKLVHVPPDHGCASNHSSAEGSYDGNPVDALQNIALRSSKQAQSLLMRLPPELRLLIWKACLCDEELYLFFSHHHRYIQTFHVKDRCENLGERNHTHPRNIGILRLLQTCRAIYCEAVGVLYKSAFTFCDIYSFLAFCAFIPPRCLSLIANVTFSFERDSQGPLIDELELDSEENIGPGFGVYGLMEINQAFSYSRIECGSRLLGRKVLPMPNKALDRTTTWDIACLVLTRMKGLRRFKMMVDENRINTLNWMTEYPENKHVVIRGILGLLEKVWERGLDRFEVCVGSVKWHGNERPHINLLADEDSLTVN
ncbi:hypothetical protein CC78DRAFT_567523 [Lojkania enalia]|uniref:DUF7730 domain-containing protein n=1 Tax=Lojkania enalia TaxID=147567 RepID=A0A9P4KB73_9PLEO|nr:hypothetical protein CC78DRAFT_567523 [Didymosphaeria enalia]